MIQKVFILGGTGNVARETVKQIIENSDNDPSRHPNPTRIVGLISRKSGLIYQDGGIKDATARDFSEGRVKGVSYGKLQELLDIVREDTVFIDATDGKRELLDFHLETIERNEHSIVTANKNPLTLSTPDEFRELTNDYDRYGFSCSVMAGAGAIRFIRNCPDINDAVFRIEGCMSGTLGYIPTRLEEEMQKMEYGMGFSAIVEEAWAKKYTEPHPADDLDGGDVARKAIILARTAGLEVKPENISIVPFIPKEYFGERQVQQFIANLKRLDGVFAEQIRANWDAGKRLRYVSTVLAGGDGGPKITVGPEWVDKDSELGLLRGTGNKITVYTKAYKNGWTLGPVAGAGNDITARNIRDNLLDLLHGRKTSP